jgi:hypothetical protein
MADVIFTILACGVVICAALTMCSVLAPSYDGAVEKSQPEQGAVQNEAKP